MYVRMTCKMTRRNVWYDSFTGNMATIWDSGSCFYYFIFYRLLHILWLFMIPFVHVLRVLWYSNNCSNNNYSSIFYNMVIELVCAIVFLPAFWVCGRSVSVNVHTNVDHNLYSETSSNYFSYFNVLAHHCFLFQLIYIITIQTPLNFRAKLFFQ